MNMLRSRFGDRRATIVGALLLVLALAIAATGCGGSSKSSTAPNFSASDLAETAGDDWVTNGGSTWNQRYSSLDEIDASNVGQLKGVWRTHLNGSATAAKYSAESQPVEYNGVLYITTGADDVFAISVETGKILWEHKANLDEKISTVCCGWLNRGVGLGDGRVYYAQLSGEIVALDQKTGEPVWTRKLVKWEEGQTITGAPLYMDGRIYIGVVGSEFGTRSFLEAMDAKDGKSIWRFNTIPGPEEPGGDTWPADDPTQYLRGGASVWSTPSVDKELGLMYITTGNAGNDWYGGDRAGDNLYSASIVALDVKTGQVRWHFQEVHHDVWDYDTPSPAVLFDAEKDGKTIKGVGVPGKTGWLYLLDRETGKALYGIDEKPVPQSEEQKTAKTQPFPRTGEFIPKH